ncbi:MAG: alpha/beta hydrolase [Pseudomonadota bacterium]
MKIPTFSDHFSDVNGQRIGFSTAGTGDPVLLLHGFPQTRAMWHSIAPVLAENYCVIASDLRGYGQSSKPPDMSDYSFRNLAQDQRALMQDLGHDSFHVIGHDRGARTAHRLALDAPDAVRSLTVMDIVPTYVLLSELNCEVASAYYHWFFLAQPEPFPETLIMADPDFYFESCLLGWGGAKLTDFNQGALNAYRTAWSDPDTIRGMCNDYRAALFHDFADDQMDLDKRVHCPALVLYGRDGVMAQHYDVARTWLQRFTNMQAAAVPGGHFFPDTNPKDTTDALREFLQRF